MRVWSELGVQSLVLEKRVKLWQVPLLERKLFSTEQQQQALTDVVPQHESPFRTEITWAVWNWLLDYIIK